MFAEENVKDMRVIISGMAAVGKSALAESVARQYSLKNLSAGDLLKEIAKENGYNIKEKNWWETSTGSEFCERRTTDSKFDNLLDDRLIKALDCDNIVATARAMPWIYKKECIKVWLHASQETRAQRMSNRDNISLKKALEIVKQRDISDKKLLLLLYNIELEKDFSNFDLVLNTQKLPACSVELIVMTLLNNLET